MAPQSYLKTRNKSIPIIIQPTPTGLLFWQASAPDKIFEIVTSQADQPTAERLSIGIHARQRLTDDQFMELTPADVIAYFEQSPVLSAMAGMVDDVRSALAGAVTSQDRPKSKTLLQQDLAAIAGLDDPSQADVAEVLFGDRTKTGGSYRRRILRALKAKTATTTSQTGQHGPVAAERAA